MPERIIDDIWADEAGVSIRFVALEHGKLRIEFTTGVGRPAAHRATLTEWRAKRVSVALAQAFLGQEA